MSRLRVLGIALAVALASQAPAEACSVCFGDVDSSMNEGMNNGILALLGVVAVVQGGFVALFLSIRRRARKLRERRDSFRLIEGGVR